MDLMGLSKENINIEKVDINSFMNELYNITKDELGNIRLQLDVEKVMYWLIKYYLKIA